MTARGSRPRSSSRTPGAGARRRTKRSPSCAKRSVIGSSSVPAAASRTTTCRSIRVLRGAGTTANERKTPVTDRPKLFLDPARMRRILAVTDAIGLHRESVRVPLAPRGAGSIQVTEGKHLEIVVPEDADFETWLAALPIKLQELDLSRVRRNV